MPEGQEGQEEVKQTVDPSTTEQTQEVVTESADTTQQEVTTEATETPETQTETGQPQVEPVDEQGVPWKNRAYEWKRKSDDLAEKLPTLIKDAVSQSMGQHQQQPQYSVEQLEAFATQTDNPAHQQWARSEIRKLDKEDQAKLIRGEFEKVQQRQQAVQVQKQSYDYVSKNYPEVFQRDAQGNTLGWNNSHPLTRMIGEFMNNPELKNRPDALVIASDMAYGRYARMKGLTTQQKNQQLKKEVKNLQKHTLVEGGGREGASSVPVHKAAIDRLKETGSMKDAQAAIAAVMKAKRASEE